MTQLAKDATQQNGPAHSPCCLDCGTTLVGPRCHRCGQPAGAHRSVAHIVEEALHGILHLDGKIWRTLPLLLFRPGKLIRAYVYGQRTRYVGPVAIFLVAVLAAIIMLSFASNDPLARGTHSPYVVAVGDRLDELAAVAREFSKRTVGAVASPERLRALESNPDYFTYKFRSLASKLSVLLVPFALPILWLLFFWRRDVKMFDHAVFLLYELSMLALLLGCARLLRVPMIELSMVFLLVLPLVHLTAAFKEAYVSSWPAAVTRTTIFFAGMVTILWLFTLGITLIVASE
jgi:hypothetical protein